MENPLSEEEKIAKIEEHFTEILSILGLDLSHGSIQKTPHRVAKMYVKEIFQGLNIDNFPRMTILEDPVSTTAEKGGLIVSQCSFTSMCEHHLVPMIGKAYIGYIPNKKLLGLSKLNRIVRYFAARPQLQERLTAQIVDSIRELTESEDIACTVIAQHCCVLMRGVKDEKGITTTNFFSGQFKTDLARQKEFYHAMKTQSSYMAY